MKSEQENFNNILSNMISRKLTFKVMDKRSNRSIFINKKCVYQKNVSKIFTNVAKGKEKQIIISFIGNVKKSVNRYLASSNLEVPYVSKVYPASFRNEDSIMQLRNGSFFYHIDVNHCYWRVAYLLGIISENMYKDVLEKEEFKTWRNSALAMIISGKTVSYYKNGILQNEIKESTDIYNRVYDLIRHTVHDIFGTICFDKLDTVNCLGYKVDAVLVKKKFVPLVEELLDMYNLPYKIIKCKKINNKTYLWDVQSGDRILDVRNF